MSNTSGQTTFTRSMNGLIDITDGAGFEASGGTVKAETLEVNNLSTQNIIASDPTASSSLYTANTGNVFIGSNSDALFLKNLYTQTQGGIQFLETTNPTAPFSFLSNNTNDILGDLRNQMLKMNPFFFNSRETISAAKSMKNKSGANFRT